MPKIGIFRLFAGMNWLLPASKLAFPLRPTVEIADEIWLRSADLTFTTDFPSDTTIYARPTPRASGPRPTLGSFCNFNIWWPDPSSRFPQMPPALRQAVIPARGSFRT
jgi:hypothetical protein